MYSKIYYIIALAAILLYAYWQISSIYFTTEAKPVKNYEIGLVKGERGKKRLRATVANKKERLALTNKMLQVGDTAYQEDNKESYELVAENPSKTASWKLIPRPKPPPAPKTAKAGEPNPFPTPVFTPDPYSYPSSTPYSSYPSGGGYSGGK